MKTANYDTDAYAWAIEQAALLRAGKVAQLDFEHLAEEIESMGKREKRALIAQLSRLLMHLLKWEFQPERRSRSWHLTIEDAQTKTLRLLDDNPSLRSILDELLATAYADAKRGAAIETEIDPDTFPANCVYTFDEAITFRPTAR